MFDAIVHRRIDLEGLAFDIVMDDVEALNRAAFTGSIEVTKLSYHAYAYCAETFALLDAGSALGRGCGPLLIARQPIPLDEVAEGGLTIAIPGRYTTANLLLGLAFPAAQRKQEMVFSAIESAVLEGLVHAGVIIHENRFTYAARGLAKIVDLGDHWEQATGAAIPLGAIVVKRALPVGVQQAVNRVMRRSIEYAFAHPEKAMPFVRAHAQEMADDVMREHIDLYVNEYSIDLGVEGRRAIDTLFARGAERGILPAVSQPLFVTGTVPVSGCNGDSPRLRMSRGRDS
jgi:1,4-dihydroxy-6-naphthoate synthase